MGTRLRRTLSLMEACPIGMLDPGQPYYGNAKIFRKNSWRDLRGISESTTRPADLLGLIERMGIRVRELLRRKGHSLWWTWFATAKEWLRGSHCLLDLCLHLLKIEARVLIADSNYKPW